MSDDKSKNMDRYIESIQPTAMNTAINDIRRMFVDEIQVPRIVNNNQTPAKRAAFAKTHGAVYGTFQVSDNLPQKYQLGIFKPGNSYNAWVRYSSDIAQTAPDLNSTVGIGIKLFDVPGKKSMEQEPNGTTLDFILQNTEVFFASDAVDMANFKSAAIAGNLDAFLVQNPELAAVLESMEKKVNSLLREPLWSCVPYKFGDDYCKFSLRAETVPDPDRAPDVNANNYLAQDLAQRLMNGEVKLSFYVQIRNNPATQSIISARSLWDEREAIPVKVATLILYKQNIKARQQQEYGESLSFNLWRTLAEMEPVGSIAEARKVTYLSSSEVRRNVNGQSIGEPMMPREPRLSSQPVFIPTVENPWPKGTLGNVTEDFTGAGAFDVQVNQIVRTFPEITISARDIHYPILINHRGTLSGSPLMQKGIIYINYPYHGYTSIRLFFEKHKMKSVSFDLIVAGGIDDSLLKISAYHDNNLTESHQVGEINTRITITPSNGSAFDLLTFEFGRGVFAINLNNFVMTYA